MKDELKDYEKMTNIDVIREKVDGYVKEHFGLETPIFDPIFREENGKYYLGYMVVDFVDEKKEDFRFKRPTKWLLVDIVTGDLVNCFDSNNHDYIDKDKFPFDLIFDNYGNSALFDSSNYVLTSFFDWKKQVIKEMKEKFSNNNLFIDPKILRLENETISPNDFVLANVESILEDMHNEIMEKLGNKVGELYKDYYVYIIDLIRKHYVISGDINRTLLSSYMDLIKYLWPDFIDIINAFDNIDHFNDPNFENALKKLVQDKTEKINKKDDIVARIDEKLKEVNPNYDSPKLKDMNHELNLDEQTPVDKTIATLDKRIAELEGEEKTNYTVDDVIDKIDQKIAELDSEENK